jgi:formate C-acetyltransferase
MANGAPGDAERVRMLRERCLERRQAAGPWGQWSALTARSLQATEGLSSWQARQGIKTRDRLAWVKLATDDLELLAGRLAPPAESCTEAEEAAAREYLRRHPAAPGQTGHCELDRTRLLAKGIDGIADELRGRKVGATPEQAETYESFLQALRGLTTLAENAAATAEATAAGAPEWRREELARTADICRRVAHLPPRSFQEGLQLLWLTDLAVMFGDGVGLVGPGHLDRTLFPLYDEDLRAGRLTRERALLLLESLYLLLNEFIPRGLAIPVMVGGRDAAGRDVTNDLSYLCLEALRRTKLAYPTVGICWHEDTPQSLTDLAVDLIGRGHSTPAFFGDETIQRGLRRYGAPPGQACAYINSTCVEITPSGASNVWVASPYFSLCKTLTDEIQAQAEDGPALDYESFTGRYRLRLAAQIAAAAQEQNRMREARRQRGRKPLQSVFTRDCIDRGRDIDDGGAIYNWVECSFVGLANLADSLHVIREEVYRRRAMTIKELHEVLASDYAGREEVRLRFLNGHPKYGNGCAEVDALVAETVAFATRECARHVMAPDASPFVPGAFCWIQHMRLGLACGATPDGRRAGLPFADGGGPAQGRERQGPTAAILSATSWDHSPLIGGLAYNMKFNTSLFNSPESFARLRDLIVTYLRRGGFEVQVNVVDHETLRKARADPERYRDLVVRIGGYTDYFVRLQPEMQDEVMARAEFGAL